MCQLLLIADEVIHSYQAEMSQFVVAYAEYGAQIPAIVQHRHYIGIQFHPEKSGENGLAILNQDCILSSAVRAIFSSESYFPSVNLTLVALIKSIAGHNLII